MTLFLKARIKARGFFLEPRQVYGINIKGSTWPICICFSDSGATRATSNSLPPNLVPRTWQWWNGRICTVNRNHLSLVKINLSYAHDYCKKIIYYMRNWVGEWKRWSESCVLTGCPGGQDGPILPARDFPRWSRKKKFSFWPYEKSFTDHWQACSVKMAVYWLRSFLRFYWPLAWVSDLPKGLGERRF